MEPICAGEVEKLGQLNTNLFNFVKRGGWKPISLFATIAVALAIAGMGTYWWLNSGPPPIANRMIPLQIAEAEHPKISDAVVLIARVAAVDAENYMADGKNDDIQWYNLAKAAKAFQQSGSPQPALSAYRHAIDWSARFEKAGRPLDLRSLSQLYAGAAACLEGAGIESDIRPPQAGHRRFGHLVRTRNQLLSAAGYSAG